jgi:hypothetical protein
MYIALLLLSLCCIYTKIVFQIDSDSSSSSSETIDEEMEGSHSAMSVEDKEICTTILALLTAHKYAKPFLKGVDEVRRRRIEEEEG